MTSLTGDFQTDLPVPDTLVACTEAIDGLGWDIETVEDNRIASYANTGTPHPPKIEVVLNKSEEGTDVRIIGTDSEADPLPQDALIAELSRVRGAIQSSLEKASGAQGETTATQAAAPSAPASMADNENKAVILFADGESLYVQSTVKQIHDEIGGLTTPHIPLIKVVDEHGVDLWMNANHIRAFHEFVAGRPIGGLATIGAQRDAEKVATQAEVAAKQETKDGVFDSMREVLSRFQEGARGRDPDS